MKKRNDQQSSGMNIQSQRRKVVVMISLVASVTIGAVVLMALDRSVPAGGAYSLASYLRLNPVDKVALDPIEVQPAGWNRIEIYYSQTDSGTAEDLEVIEQLRSSGRMKTHFIVCNGFGADDGQIQSTKDWKTQIAVNNVIRICVIADQKFSPATDCQIRRTTQLVETLSRRFQVLPERIKYPADWQL